LNSRLYLVLDRDTCYQGKTVDVFRQVDKGAVDLVQLRANTAPDREFLRDAENIKRLAHRRGIIFIINNRLDIAQIVDADGVHLGQSDSPIKLARKILGEDKIIGLSCHNLTQALKAQSEGADYISIGPLFRTKTKPESKPIPPKFIKMIDKRIGIPYFVIGGINRSNIGKVISYGAKRMALCRAICCAKNIKKTSLDLRKFLKNKK